MMRMTDFIKMFGDRRFTDIELNLLIKLNKDRRTIIDKIEDSIYIGIFFSVKNKPIETKYFTIELSKENEKELLVIHKETSMLIYKVDLEVKEELRFIAGVLIDILISEYLKLKYEDEWDRDLIEDLVLKSDKFLDIIRYVQAELIDMYLLNDRII